MNCWQILQIEPTSDERAIRRAYAKQLKTTRPDDDAQAYQQLREAFDEALSIAPYVEEEADDWSWHGTAEEMPSENISSENTFNTFDGTADKTAGVLSDGMATQQIMPFATANQVIDECYRLYHSGGGKALLKLWPGISARLQGLDETEYEILREYLADWLSRPGGLPKKLLKIWQKQFDILPSEQSDGFSDGIQEIGTQQIMAEIKQIYQTGGSDAVYGQWDNIRTMLDAVPFDDMADVSWQMLDFLREHQIANPLVWSQWSHYFGWHEDYRLANYLSAEEIELLYQHLHFAGALDDSRQDSPYPVLRGLRRLWDSGKRKQAKWLAILLEDELEQEMPSAQRHQLAAKHQGLSEMWYARRTSTWLNIIGAVPVFFAAVWVANNVYRLPEQEWNGLIGNPLGVVAQFVAAYFLMCIWSGFTALIPKTVYNFFQIERHRRWAFIRLFALPLLAAGLTVYPDWVTVDWMLMVIACSLFFSWSSFGAFYGLGFRKWLAVNSVGFVLLALGIKPEVKLSGSTIVWILWLNSALYCRFFCENRFQKWQQAMEYPVRTAWTWLTPVYWLRSAVLALWLLPAFSGEYAQRGRFSTLINRALLTVSLLLLLPLPYPRIWWFYPVLLLVCGMAMMIKNRLIRYVLNLQTSNAV